MEFESNQILIPDIQLGDSKALEGFIYTVTRDKCLNPIKLNSIHEDIPRNQVFSCDFFSEIIQ